MVPGALGLQPPPARGCNPVLSGFVSTATGDTLGPWLPTRRGLCHPGGGILGGTAEEGEGPQTLLQGLGTPVLPQHHVPLPGQLPSPVSRHPG